MVGIAMAVERLRSYQKENPMAKKAKKPTRRAPAKAKRAPKRKPSTAIARVKRAEVLPPEVPEVVTALEARTVQAGGGLQVGKLGLVELKLTAKEEQVLSKPVPAAEIRIKPTAHPQPYLSHPTYTRWFGEAFGRTGWALVPVGTPTLDPDKRSVVQPYILHVHGAPVAYAMGEQEYFPGNKEQTYGDALESTVANALRRCAKRLGVGLEMWDRDFLDGWVAANCVRVKVRNRDGSEGFKWRRKVDPSFPFEIGVDRFGDPREEERTSRPAPRAPQQERPAGHHRHSSEPITQKQRQRLWVIIRNSGRSEDQVKEWLSRRFGITSTKAVTREIYDFVCSAIESPADLPNTSEREVGQEG